MPFEILAIISGFFFSLSTICIRRGLEGSTPHTGSLIVTLTNFAGFTLALAFVDYSQLHLSWHWAAFLAAGLASPAASLFFMYRSVSALGVAPTTSIGNQHAIFGAFWAFLLIGERPPPIVWAGIVVVVSGVYLLTGGGSMRGKLRYLWLPVLSANCFAVAHVFRRMGFGGMDSLIFGGFLQGASAALVAPLLLPLTNRGRAYVFSRRSVGFYLLAGCSMIFAQISLLMALRLGKVSLVSPLLSSGPLFALLLAPLLLGKREPITPRVAAGVCLIVLGAVLVAALR